MSELEKVNEISESSEKDDSKNKAKKKKKKVFKVLAIIFLCLFIFILIGIITVESILIYNNYKLIYLNECVKNLYLFEYDENDIYKSMIDSLNDKYSVYYTKEEFDEMMESSSGEYEGIGAYLTQEPDLPGKPIKVVKPIKNSPAEIAGLKPDDIIIEVDGEEIYDYDINYATSKIRGKEGTTVHLKIQRDDEYLEFDIKRAKLYSESTEYKMLEDEIGYIMVSSFEENTDEQFIEAIDNLLNQNMKSLIIDLRSNGGGYVDTCLNMVNRILPSGSIMYTEDKNGKKEYYNSDDKEKLDIPIVILVDENSASASEIFTGALKDRDAAVVIGTLSFGKGIVQDVLELPDGSGLKITESRYYTPNGICIHEKGIEPDIEVELNIEAYKKDNIDNQLDAAIDYLNNN